MNDRKTEQALGSAQDEGEPVSRTEAIEALERVARASDPSQARQAIESARAILGEAAPDYEALFQSLSERALEVHKLHRLAGTDPLTGIANRRAFEQALERELARHERTRQGFAVLLLDLDDLKPLNDTHGHAAGDRAIRTVAQCCEETLRKTDLVARLGGDEFAVLLPGADEGIAYSVARRIRIAVEDVTVCGVPLRISIGASVVRPGPDGDDDIMGRADTALYAEKALRRNVRKDAIAA